MLVSRVQDKVVLQDQGRQPHVVCRNGRALFPKLAEDGSVVVSRLVVGKEHAHAIFQEKTSQNALVLGLPAPVDEAGAKLTDYNERQHNGLGFFKKQHGLDDAFTEIDVWRGGTGHCPIQEAREAGVPTGAGRWARR